MVMDTRDFQARKTPGGDFNAVDVINKTYADSNEYDLNDALIFLTKAISKTKARNKQLVKQHFGKFVQCRTVLEEIWEDIQKKGYDQEFTSELENNIRAIEEKFRSITSTISDDSKNEAVRGRREYYTKKYQGLFNVKADLQKNLHNLERFVDIYEGASKMYEQLKCSVYVQRVWSSIHDERCEFLEVVYRNIQRPGCTFHEALYYFDLYFRVCEHKSEHKIMNTLLVNFKENSVKSLEELHLDKNGCLEEITRHYLKLMERVDGKIQVQGTNHYFRCIEDILCGGELLFAKIWIRRLMENVKAADLSMDAKRTYFSHLKRVRTREIDRGFEYVPAVVADTFGRAMEHLKTTFDLFADITSKEEERYLRAKTLEYVDRCYTSVELTKFSDLDTVVKHIYGIRHLLGPPDSEGVKDLYRMINGYMESHTARIVGSVAEMIKQEAPDARVLMEMVRVVEEMPMEHLRIIKHAAPLLEKYPVVMYYLSGLLGIEPPSLSNDHRERADEIRSQFGFLLGT